MNMTTAQIQALNEWARTEPALRRHFDYTLSQGVGDSTNGGKTNGYGDTLAQPTPGSEEEVSILQKEVDFADNDATIYQGFADPGTKTSEAKWRIRRTKFRSNAPNSDDVIVWYAENDNDFVHVWDDRESLSYGP